MLFFTPGRAFSCPGWVGCLCVFDPNYDLNLSLLKYHGRQRWYGNFQGMWVPMAGHRLRSYAAQVALLLPP